jgi:O-succinylbenzoic acid--CoA ligase
VLPLDPTAPPAALDALLARFRPTHVDSGDGPVPYPGGIPVPAGTAAVVVTSGTATGVPKGVELTYDGLRTMGRGYFKGLAAGPGDHWLACLPLHHVAALAIIGRAWVTGVPWTAHERFDLDRVARSPRDEQTTIVSLVPTTLARLLDAGAPLHEFRRVVVGGAPCPPALRERAEGAGVHVVDAYGLSETWGGFALDGMPIPGVEVRLDTPEVLVDDDVRRAAVDDPVGEVCVRGPVVMRGYRLAPDTTRTVLDDDGWLHTGDAGTFDGHVVRVVDRRKDLVISGGVNVSPTEVEGVLARHPAVADVCVVGAPDDEWGERVVAFVVPAPGAPPPTTGELRSFAREFLAPAKLPREVRLVDEVPRSPGGKPLRRLLR